MANIKKSKNGKDAYLVLWTNDKGGAIAYSTVLEAKDITEAIKCATTAWCVKDTKTGEYYEPRSIQIFKLKSNTYLKYRDDSKTLGKLMKSTKFKKLTEQ